MKTLQAILLKKNINWVRLHNCLNVSTDIISLLFLSITLTLSPTCSLGGGSRKSFAYITATIDMGHGELSQDVIILHTQSHND